MGQPRTLRRRWMAAGLVSLGAHALVFLGLSLTPREGPPPPAPPVLITLERLERPPLATRPEPAPTRAAANPLRLHQPAAPSISAPSFGLSAGPPLAPAAPGAPSTVPPQQAAAAPPLKLDCLHLGPAARGGAFGREDCEAGRYYKPAEGAGGYAVPQNPEWEAALARQQSKHRPLPPEKPFRNTCANSNLGLGCTDDTLWTVGKRKF